MSNKHYITSYVSEKVWPDGGRTISFKLDQYTRKKLMEVPDGTYIQINKKRNPDEKEVQEGNLYYMYCTLAQQAQQPQTTTF